MAKPNKSILKRVKITKRGKIIRRKSGQNHFNAKESRRHQRRKRETLSIGGRMAKLFKSRV